MKSAPEARQHPRGQEQPELPKKQLHSSMNPAENQTEDKIYVR